MTAEIKLLNLSGTVGAFAGSHAAAICLLVGISGTQYIPLQTNDAGFLRVVQA